MERYLLIDEKGRVASYSEGEIVSNKLQKILISIKGEDEEMLKKNQIVHFINNNFIFTETPTQIEERNLQEIEVLKEKITIDKDSEGIDINDVASILEKLIN